MSSRFRFRDLQEMEDSSHSDYTSDVSSGTSNLDEESELHSMAGKGIQHLCSELVELKAASSEDFLRNVMSNCSVFVRIFQEAEDMQNEVTKLRTYVLIQKGLVRDLIEVVYVKVLSEGATSLEETDYDELSCLNELEARINGISETLDILISENRTDEALDIIESQEEGFQRVQFEDNYPLDMLTLYNSVISEAKGILKRQLTLVAESRRIGATELQKALVGLCRLGETHLATQLLLKYYHSRITNGMYNLQRSRSHLHGVYIRDIAKCVFSLIAQAAKSFLMLYGQTCPYASELIQWTHEEIHVFVGCFNKYVKSISEISRGLSMAVEAVQFAKSFCSLLEAHRLVLQPHLTNLIRPSMEEMLKIHIEHSKKVINIFAASDSWVLGRYLVLGILSDDMVLGQEPEYCLLTNSGRKFLTMLQAFMEDASTVINLQMEGSVLSGLMNLFSEYTTILERAISWKTIGEQKGTSRNKLNGAELLRQQVSILANVSTIRNFFSGIIRKIFRGLIQANPDLIDQDLIVSHQKELDINIIHIEEDCEKLRTRFCQQFICKIMSFEAGSELTSETYINGPGDLTLLHATPSVPVQVLFLKLRQLEKLSEDNVFEVEWLMELLRELVEDIFGWLSDKKEIWATTKENSILQHSEQIVLDIQFLVEIVKYGGYFSERPMILTNLMKSAFLSVGMDLERDDSWAIHRAREAIQELLEIEKKQLLSQVLLGTQEEEQHEDLSGDAKDFIKHDSVSSLEKVFKPEEVATSVSEGAMNIENVDESSPGGGSLHLLEGETEFNNKVVITSASTYEEVDNSVHENAFTDS